MGVQYQAWIAPTSSHDPPNHVIIPEFRSAENAIDAGLLFAPSGVALGHGVGRKLRVHPGTRRAPRPKLGGTIR